MDKVIKIEKNSVQETLMLPLLGKAKCMEWWPNEFHDNDVLRIKEMIDYDFSQLESKISGVYGRIGALAAEYRQFALAEEIRRYLANHPKALVVFTGCGLDTVGHQADNGLCQFVNIDFPNVIETREKLLPSTEREHNVASDLNDYSWFEKIDFHKEDGAIFVASGVLMYFKTTEVEQLFRAMAKQFPGAAYTFDVQNSKGRSMDLRYLKDSGIDISLNFCLEKSTAEQTLQKMCPLLTSAHVQGMVYPYKDPKPFGLLFRLMERYSDHGMGMIATITF